MEGGRRDIGMLTLDREGRKVSRLIIQAHEAGIPGIGLGDVVERSQAISIEWGKFRHGGYPNFHLDTVQKAWGRAGRVLRELLRGMITPQRWVS